MNHLSNLKMLAVSALIFGSAFQAEARDHRDLNPGRPGYHDDFDHGYGYMDRYQAEKITRLLYRAILFRQGEPKGVYDNARAIMQHGVQSVAASMASSPEYYQNIHRRYRPETIVDNVYRVLLGRSRDYASQGWVDLVREGRADEALYGITDSPEFRQRHGIY